VNHLDRFKVFSWTGSAVRRLNEAGLRVVLITNQSGVARGYFDEALLDRVHDRLQDELALAGARLDGLYYCPHHPAGKVAPFACTCDCRKPGLGMINRAVEELQLDPGRSFFVGDTYRDMETGFRAGARSILVLTGYGKGELEYQGKRWKRHPDHVAEHLGGAVDWILAEIENA